MARYRMLALWLSSSSIRDSGIPMGLFVVMDSSRPSTPGLAWYGTTKKRTILTGIEILRGVLGHLYPRMGRHGGAELL